MSQHLTRSISASRTGRVDKGSALLATLAVALMTAMFVSAGFWQLHRAHLKDELRARTEAAMHDGMIELSGPIVPAEQLEFRQIHVEGNWLADKTIFLDNKIRDSVVGYQVVTPLRIHGGDTCVLVNRGWIEALPLRSELPEIDTPTGLVQVSGIARAPSNRFLELSAEVEQGRVWQNLTIDRFRAWSRLELQPVVLFQQDAGDSQLKRIEVAPEASGLNADRHRGYALTWFGLGLVTLSLALFAKFKSKLKKTP